MKAIFKTLLLSILVSFPTVVVAQFSASELEFFESKIRPMLLDHCAECHGQEVEGPEGGFSIASRAAMLLGGDTGPAIVPGKPKESLLIESVNYDGPYEMPPSSKLDNKSIQLLTQWIEMGAPWPSDEDAKLAKRIEFDLEQRKQEHWCWQPVTCPEPPEIKQPNWALDPIDRFVFQKMVGAGLEPAVDATRPEWLRRVYFDLVGLPPTPEQVDAFVSDQTPRAHERIVDELLDSPHFGERWARHWMDLFRYAETYGHEFDYPIAHAYEYRDYLIRAFNQDVPYDELIREHVAGDLLDEPRLNPEEPFNESVIGTGFWFLGEATHAPVDVKADEAGRIDNQIDVLCKSFLGLTVACARCHDHKFDAISDEDYYALSGFLQSSRRQKAMLESGQEISNALSQMRPKIELANEKVRQFLGAVTDIDVGDFDWKSIGAMKGAKNDQHPFHALYLAFVAEVPDGLRKKTFDGYLKRLKAYQQKYDKFVNESVPYEEFSNGVPKDWFTTGWSVERKSRETFEFSPTESLILAPGTVSSGSAGGKFYGVLRSPTFELSHDRIHVRARGNIAEIRLIIDGYEMDIHNALLFKGCKFEMSTPRDFQWMNLDGDVKNYRGHKAWLEFKDIGDSFFEIDEIRFSNNTDSAPAMRPTMLGKKIAETIIGGSDSTIEKSINECINHLLSNPEEYSDDETAQWLSLIAEVSDQGAELVRERESFALATRDVPKPKLTIAMTEGTPEDEHFFIRGNSNTLGDPIPRRFLTALKKEAERDSNLTGSGRLQLANQIATADNPLTSRVVVNRIWHHLMGRGIVVSVDNFGALGERPTHPRLLDYLASEFVKHNWSVKRLIKRLVLSRTYRMSSELNPNAVELDPDNRLLHRGNVRRLSGEAIRDAMLSVSGSLDRTLYGKSVPIHLTEFMQGRGRPRSGGPLDGNGRRSIYLAVRRNFLSPMMLAFDTPIPFNAIGKRHQSNVPAQALILMNDPFVIEQAARWAKRLIEYEPDPDKRMEMAFREALGRLPTKLEIVNAKLFFDQQAEALSLDDEGELQQKLWQDFCHVIFNMKEFIYIR